MIVFFTQRGLTGNFYKLHGKMYDKYEFYIDPVNDYWIKHSPNHYIL
jgi:hypothetical protein